MEPETTSAPANGVAKTEPAKTGETPDIAKLVESAVNAALAPLTKKYNGEFAALRKLVKGGGGEGEGSPAPAVAQPALTVEDLDAAMSVGELRATLPKNLREKLQTMTEGMGHRERLKLYQAAAEIHAEAASSGRVETTEEKSRGETPAQPRSSRAAVSAVRESAPRPQSLTEYVNLAKTDPKRKAALDADPDFDPSDLPRR